MDYPRIRFFSAIFAVAVFVLAAAGVSAQLRLPRPSQWASVTQTVGVTDITIS
jgi:hypothetical protein